MFGHRAHEAIFESPLPRSLPNLFAVNWQDVGSSRTFLEQTTKGLLFLYLTRRCLGGWHSSSGQTRSGKTSPTVWKPSEEAAPLPARAVVGLGFLEGELSKKRDMGRRSTEGVRGVCAEDVHVRIL